MDCYYYYNSVFKKCTHKVAFTASRLKSNLQATLTDRFPVQSSVHLDSRYDDWARCLIIICYKSIQRYNEAFGRLVMANVKLMLQQGWDFIHGNIVTLAEDIVVVASLWRQLDVSVAYEQICASISVATEIKSVEYFDNAAYAAPVVNSDCC